MEGLQPHFKLACSPCCGTPARVAAQCLSNVARDIRNSAGNQFAYAGTANGSERRANPHLDVLLYHEGGPDSQVKDCSIQKM